MPVTCIGFPDQLPVRLLRKKVPAVSAVGTVWSPAPEERAARGADECIVISLWPRSRVVGRIHPQIIGWQLEKAFSVSRRNASITAQPQIAELEKIFLAIAQEHAGDELCLDAILGCLRHDSRALQPDHAGGCVADRESTPCRTPQPPA